MRITKENQILKKLCLALSILLILTTLTTPPKQELPTITGLDPTIIKNIKTIHLTPNKINMIRNQETLIAIGTYNNQTRQIELYLPPTVSKVLCHELHHNKWYTLPETTQKIYESYLNLYTEEIKQKRWNNDTREYYASTNSHKLQDCYT